MKVSSLYFTGPRQLEVRQEELEPTDPGEVLVEVARSAISAGTELLFYRGQVPSGMEVDATLDSLEGRMAYPLKYGYASVGSIVDTGSEADRSLLGSRVFSFQPHQSHYWADPSALMVLPGAMEAEQGVFIPNVESAVNFAHDGKPGLGENVLVLGQGIVGLLMTAILGQFPLARLITVDRLPTRRKRSEELGADHSLDVGQVDEIWGSLLGESPRTDDSGFDLTFELTGAPAALDDAIRYTGYAGRIVLGSWYGTKSAAVALGGKFHRSRIRIMSSQVSSIAPELSGRWSKTRRMEEVLRQIEIIQPEQLITHRYPIEEAAEAYSRLDSNPEEVLQAVLTYA